MQVRTEGDTKFLITDDGTFSLPLRASLTETVKGLGHRFLENIAAGEGLQVYTPLVAISCVQRAWYHANFSDPSLLAEVGAAHAARQVQTLFNSTYIISFTTRC